MSGTKIWQGRVLDVATRYGDSAPLAATCCNACRTCAATNVATLALGAVLAAGSAVLKLAERITSR